MTVSSRHLYSRSAREIDLKCRRARYWQTVYKGRGISPRGRAVALTFGTAHHAGMQVLFKRADVADDDVRRRRAVLAAVAAARAIAAEISPLAAWLVECLVRGYARTQLPALLAQYRVLSVEHDYPYDHGTVVPLRLMTRPDLIVEDRVTGELVYVEFKTARSVTGQWVASWNHAVQIPAGASAFLQQERRELAYAVVQGFLKGYEADGYWASPFTSAWRHLATDEVVPKRPPRWAGWERIDVMPWCESEGLTAESWVKRLPEDILVTQFPRTAPIYIDADETREWHEECEIREAEISAAGACLQMGGHLSPTLLRRHFPKNRDMCAPAYGAPCEYHRACWDESVKKAPELTPFYEPRMPHHPEEAARFVCALQSTAA